MNWKLGTTAMAGAFALTSVAQAATLSDGDFEAGLGAWVTGGNVTIADGSTLGISPLDGTNSALLSTGGSTISDAAAETQMGIAAGSLDALATSNGTQTFGATQGSVITQEFDVVAGETISFDFQLFANDCPLTGIPGCAGIEDGAFVSLTIDGLLEFLIGTSDSSMVASGSSFAAESTEMSFSHVIGTSGTATFGIAMFDFSDTIVDSALLVDNVALSTAAPVPLPASSLLLLGGVGGMVALRRRKKA